MVVKNYKTMCQLLEENECTGNSKKSQLKRWSRYLHWINDGHKFVIKEIYEEPLPVEDGRSDGNRAMYVRLIEWLLAQDLSKREGYTHTLTRKKWWNLLGMVNWRYKSISNDTIKSVSSLHTDTEIQWFYNRSYSILNEILRNALRSMCDRALIDYEIQTIIVKPNSEWFKASDSDIAKLQTVRRSVLKEMGLAKEKEAFYRGVQNEYYHKVNSIIKQQYQWVRYFKQIKIIFNPKNISDAIPELEQEINRERRRQIIDDKKSCLNNEVVNRMNRDAARRNDEAINNCCSGKGYFLFPIDYIEAQKSLTDYLINLESYSGKDDIQSTNLDFSNISIPEIDDLFLDLLE